MDKFGDCASLNGDLAGLGLGEALTLASLRAGHMQQRRLFQSSSWKGQAWLPHHMEEDPEISNIQLGKLTKSICFPDDNHTADGSWKFSVQGLPFPLALGNEAWFSIKTRAEQFILLLENVRESEAPTASQTFSKSSLASLHIQRKPVQ